MRGKLPALLAIAALSIAACGGDDNENGDAADDTADDDGSTASATAAATDDAASATAAATDDAAVSSDAVPITYQLWDANQLPAYEACAGAFETANPGIDVQVKQLGWDDYWTGITTGFVSGTAPDVFTDHLAKYPEFAETEQILPLNEYIERDGVDTTIYFPGLVDLWRTPDGNQFGLPKDWDTIAFAANNQMLTDAGIDTATLGDLAWNPTDGGTFEQLMAHLSIDTNGVRGDEAGFDAANVATYGFGLVGAGGGYGQTEWSFFAASNGWEFMNQPIWGTEFNYDDPKFVETISWIKGLIDKGYAPPFEVFSATGHNDLFKAGQTATTSLGSWEIGDIVAAEFETTFFPTPIGPTGARASMFNGLADSISAGTEHPDEAWQWVKFLSSQACQDLVADTAVVFPAIPSAADTVKTARADQGVDVSAFTTHVENGTTFTFPIADYAADLGAIMGPAMEAVFTGAGEPAAILADANAQVNDLFK
jgi:multiple sugar transport system substrate-binding protein